MIDEDLEPLITKCPNCATQFRVTENQLAAAGGRVRCGACLTVFQGTDYLLLDEESTFSTGIEADAALDALLDELGPDSSGKGAAESPELTDSLAAKAVDDAAANAIDEAVEQASIETPQQIYGGFEDEADEENTLEYPADAETQAEAEAADDGIADLDSSAGQEPEEVAEPAPVVTDSQSGAIDSSKDETENEDWLEEDYEKWIEPGTASIDQLVDEVVASGRGEPAEDAAAGVEALAMPEDADASSTRAPFHLSAVEQALAEEGVGTQPISFAPEPRRWWVPAAAGLLTVLLVLQIFYLQLPEWSRDPGLRSTYEAICALTGCELPELRALDALQTRNLVVRSHPELEGALIVDVIMVNLAPFAQRYPDLQLKFTAVGGLLVAGRSFTPEEYLAGEADTGDLMPVNTPVQISLTIADPGKEAMNYTLSFR